MYLEDENGVQVSKATRSSIYKYTNTTWTTMADLGLPLGKYSDCNSVVIEWFRRELEKAFPILRLCEHHWKADNIWILNYRTWATSGSHDDDPKEELEAETNLSTKRPRQSRSPSILRATSTARKRLRRASLEPGAFQPDLDDAGEPEDQTPTPPPPPPSPPAPAPIILNPLSRIRVATPALVPLPPFASTPASHRGITSATIAQPPIQPAASGHSTVVFLALFHPQIEHVASTRRIYN
ncbi:hypothetical protein HGRIS_011087 [Hohenbuehelia grisea]|uniref:Transposase n=1 Tax=Hohenbuehelia grisea TaxID=104357 RepID=A0ABR3IZ77_9AGAR